jgi:hypothetical protein
MVAAVQEEVGAVVDCNQLTVVQTETFLFFVRKKFGESSNLFLESENKNL